MNLSYRWLQALLPGYAEPPKKTAEHLAGYGAPVEELRDIGAELADVVIARVVERQQHPNADRLSLCTVDAGGELLSVVCGAPNVQAGVFYPFAPVGATLPGGVSIRRAKIRGQESQGMLCSARELGLGRDHDGILPLTGSYEPGTSFTGTLALDDVAITIDVTPNRPDLLSHLGVARELAGHASGRAALPAIPGSAGEPPLALQGGPRTSTAEGVRVTIEDTAACPKYLGAVIRGLSVGPSPDWLSARLRAIGQRPINNVVDATNYVLHELGQPLHAFDLARLGDAVVVRMATDGETIVTLDGVERKLGADALVIADARRPVALAGVMGGEATEVTAATRDVFLECALFDPATIRRSRRAAGLSTDASYRYERGVDPDGLERALRRAVELIVAVAGGTAARNAVAAGPTAAARRRVPLRPARVRQVLGIDIGLDRIATLLGGIGFSAERSGDSLMVTVPGYRSYDVTREDDLVEEVARRFGYDEFPSDLRAFRPSNVPTHPLERIEATLRGVLVAAGMFEARTAPFAPESEGDVPLLLPLSAAEGRLRRTVLTGLMHRAEYNYARGTRDIRLFEIGTVFLAGEGGTPAEETRAAGVLTGLRAPGHWSGSSGDFEIWDLKALLESVSEAVGGVVSPATPEDIGSLPLDPARSLALRSGAEDCTLLGVGGPVVATRVDSPPWAAPLFGFEVRLPHDMAAAAVPRYRPLPAFPSVDRDLARLVPAGTAAAEVSATIRGAGGALLEDVAIFDVYEGKGVPEGLRSVGYRLLFRSPERTLTDAEVDSAVGRVLARLKDSHAIARRG
jgi:phenylalanyl-tRNA synthetase beta chain